MFIGTYREFLKVLLNSELGHYFIPNLWNVPLFLIIETILATLEIIEDEKIKKATTVVNKR